MIEHNYKGQFTGLSSNTAILVCVSNLFAATLGW